MGVRGVYTKERVGGWGVKTGVRQQTKQAAGKRKRASKKEQNRTVIQEKQKRRGGERGEGAGSFTQAAI